MNLYNPAQMRYLARLFDAVLNVLYTADPETLSSDPSSLPASQPEEATLSSPESSATPLSLSSSPHHAHPHSQSNGHTGHPPHHSHSPPFTLEDRRLQLTHALSVLNAEHTSLTSALKTARRESQKADAALRAEIDTLKRASDRHAAGESRARKKVLALQEAVKQTLAAAKDIEALVSDIEAARPALEQRKREVEREWKEVREEAERVRARREEAEGREKIRAEAGQQELAGLVNRLEKLSGKREKLEGGGGVISELEERLRKLEEERERIEKDPYGYEGDAAGVEDTESVPSVPGPARSRDDYSLQAEGDREKPSPAGLGQLGHPNTPHHNFHPGHHPHPRKRHSHPHVPHHPNQHQHHHPRPSFPPPGPRGTGPQHQDPTHRPPGHRASFPAPTHPGAGALHPHPHKSHGRNFRAHQAQGHGHGSSSSSASSTPAAGSMLSSRAPPFEPGRHRSHSGSQMQAATAAKSDLNPGSTPFAPRSTAGQAVASGAGAGVPPSS